MTEFVSPDEIWASLSPEDRQQVAAYLEEADQDWSPYREILNKEAEQEHAQQLAEYDGRIDSLVAANPDVIPERFHRHVVTAEGDLGRALEIYRSDEALKREDAIRSLGLNEQQIRQIQRSNQQRAADTEPRGYGSRAESELHNAIDAAVRLSKERRGQ